MSSTQKNNVNIVAADVEKIKPFLQIASQTGQLDKSIVGSMLAVLKTSADNGKKLVSVPQTLTRREVANTLKISTKTVSRLSDEGKLKPHKIGKRAYRYLLDEVVAYLEGGYDNVS